MMVMIMGMKKMMMNDYNNDNNNDYNIDDFPPGGGRELRDEVLHEPLHPGHRGRGGRGGGVRGQA